jgi:hypothetical protein
MSQPELLVRRGGTSDESSVNEVNAAKLTQTLAQTLAVAGKISQVERTLKKEGCENINIIPPGFMTSNNTNGHSITYTKDGQNYTLTYDDKGRGELSQKDELSQKCTVLHTIENTGRQIGMVDGTIVGKGLEKLSDQIQASVNYNNDTFTGKEREEANRLALTNQDAYFKFLQERNLYDDFLSFVSNELARAAKEKGDVSKIGEKVRDFAKNLKIGTERTKMVNENIKQGAAAIEKAPESKNPTEENPEIKSEKASTKKARKNEGFPDFPPL